MLTFILLRLISDDGYAFSLAFRVLHGYRSIVAAIADPTCAKGGKLPQESYISYMRVGHFRHLFQHCSHTCIFILNTSIDLVGIHERSAKIRVSKCPILKFLWDFENRQNWIKDVFISSFFLSLLISVPPICKHFAMELAC